MTTSTLAPVEFGCAATSASCGSISMATTRRACVSQPLGQHAQARADLQDVVASASSSRGARRSPPATCWSSRNDCDRPLAWAAARGRASRARGLKTISRDWPCTRCRSARRHSREPACSGPAPLRHPTNTPYCCFLPDLTGFEGRRRAGPGLQRCAARCRAVERTTSNGTSTPLERVSGYNGPLLRRLARPR